MSDTAKGFDPAVSVVIPCRNEAGYIEACLHKVLQFVPPPGGFEVIVVDGMSDDGTRDLIARVAERDARVRSLNNPDRTTPCALNIGVRAARGDIIVRIDAHSDYAPDYLVECLAVMHETGADNVGGPWVASGCSYIQRAIAGAFNSAFAVGGARGHQEHHEGLVDTVYLGCWRRAILEHIGLFDEEFARNQDDELNFRLTRAGGRIWQSPRIRSWYTPRSSLSGLLKQYWQYGYWKIRVMQKHGRPASLRHVVPGGFSASILALAPLAPFTTEARIALFAIVGAYLTVLAIASVLTAARSGWSLLPILPAVFPCYHLGYGFGSLFGFWDFVLCRRGRGRFQALTRERASGVTR